MAIEIFDNEEKLRSISRVLTASICDKLDGTLTFDFTVLQEGHQPILTGMTAKYGGQVYDIVRVKRGFSSGLEISEVSCEHISYTLNDKQYNLVTFVFEGTPTEGLSQLLAGTPFTVGIVEPNTMVECAFTDESPLNRRSALMRFADACGGEIEYDGFAINIRIHRGKSERVELMDGTNVTGLSATYDSRKNIQSYEIQFYKWVPISVGDEVHIRYRPLSINVNTRIIGLTYNPFDRYSVRVEVGDYVPNLLAAEAERLAGIKQEFRAANGKLESKIKSVDGSLSELNQTISGFDTRISDAEGSVSSLSQTVSGFDTRISSAEGSVSSLSQTVGGFDTRISSAEGSVSSLSQTVDGFNTRISSAEGSVSSLSQTIGGFNTRISDAEENVSSLSQSVNNIKSSVVTTDNTGNYIGTQIEQTPEWVRIAWNKYTDAVQFQNGGLYILDKAGKVLAILDGNGIVAEKGTFRGKVQSGDLSKYGVEISEGVLKGYRNNEVVAYVDTNNDVEIDGVVSPGMRIASKGGIVLRSPYLCVAKDYFDPDVHGEMLLGGNGSFNAVTSFEATGEGEDRKLVLQYKHLDFTNGIMTSNLQGGSNIVDYPEQPNPPQTDNTYQEEIEKAYADVINDLSAENMGKLSKRFFSSNIYGPTPKGEYGISGWNTDYKSGRMIIAPSTTVGVVRTTVDNIDWLPAYGFDCNPYIEGVPNSERWYGRKLLKDCGLTRNFMWPLLNTMVSNYGYVNSNMYISFFVVGYAGDSWYVSDIMRGDSSAMLANTTYGQWDLVINGNTTLTSILWWHGSPPHHACANAGRFGNSHGGSQASSILPSWFEPSDLKNYWPSVFSTINSFLVDKGMPGASDSYIAKSIMGWSASYDGKNDIYMDNLFNAPIGVQIFNINNVPHYTLGTAWKNDNYIYYYDNLIPDDHYSNANSTITNARPLVLPITKLSANLSHARIYATYDCANPSYFHEGLKRLKLMRGEFLALK